MRRLGIVMALAAVALGLASRKVHLGVALWDKSLGDIVYAVMVGGILLALRPRTSARGVALGSFAVCFALELFQLTGIPARAPRFLRFVLGSTFAWHDVACCVVGAVIVGLVVRSRAR